jgi:hypothetical protein
MTSAVLELATIKLAPHSAEADLLTASDAFQKQFLDHQDGFIRRDLVRKGDGIYLDVIFWKSRAHAEAVFARAQASEVASQYFAHMQFDPENMEEGVEHHNVLRSFARPV